MVVRKRRFASAQANTRRSHRVGGEARDSEPRGHGCEGLGSMGDIVAVYVGMELALMLAALVIAFASAH